MVLASVPRGVVPLKVKGGGGRGWGRGVAGLREAVATSDAVDARLALGWIINHFCELGLGRWDERLNEEKGKGGKGREEIPEEWRYP